MEDKMKDDKYICNSCGKRVKLNDDGTLPEKCPRKIRVKGKKNKKRFLKARKNRKYNNCDSELLAGRQFRCLGNHCKGKTIIIPSHVGFGTFHRITTCPLCSSNEIVEILPYEHTNIR